LLTDIYTMPDIKFNPSTTLSEGVKSSATHQAHASPNIQSGNLTGLTRPGSGNFIYKNRTAELSALNQSGFVSSFPSDKSSSLSQRAKAAISVSEIHNCLRQHTNLSARAHLQMEQLHGMQLNSHPEQLADVMQKTVRALRLHTHETREFAGALRTYRETNGGFYLMNIHSMGFQRLADYVAARNVGKAEPDTTSDFLCDFIDGYNALPHIAEHDEVTESDENLIQIRFETELKPATKALVNFIKKIEPIFDVTLMKGARGDDDPSSTQVNGPKLLKSVLQGDGIRFNGFLSTTSHYGEALRFADSDTKDMYGLGEPQFIVDLNSDSNESEILRRELLRALDSNECKESQSSILYVFKADNVLAVSANAVEEALAFQNSDLVQDENEILVAPGHVFLPEQVVRNQQGFLIIGTLRQPER
jgi:hypothetical protein